MRYFVTLDPAQPPVEVEVRELPSGALQVTKDGRVLDVDVLPLGSGLSARVAGRVVDLTTEGTPPDLGVIANGHRAYASRASACAARPPRRSRAAAPRSSCALRCRAAS
jgi:hypothetical protein